jgi:fumarate reductase flavoprotein subunit
VGNRSFPTAAEKDLRLYAGKGRVKISDSWNEIAQWIGSAPKVLKTTIDEYNSFCEQGHDAIFAKDRRYLLPLRIPPYLAIQGGLNLLSTHGGIKISHHMEVLDSQDNPIPGVYAAGNETGGMDSDTYDVNLSGHSFGFAINSGRIAGENAARFLLRK